MTLTLTFIGILIAIWFGRTSGRLGHGVSRALLWSVIGWSLYLGPLFGIPELYGVLQMYASAPDAGVSWSVAVSRVLAIALPVIVQREILRKARVPSLSVLKEADR